MKVIATNKKAHFNYDILEKYIAGVALQGSEVKSIRLGNMRINDAFVSIRNNEVFLKNSFIKQYEKASSFVPKTDRDRKLLLNKNEILKLKQKSAEKGLTIVPLAVGFSNNLVKVEIGLCKGKKLYDKKNTLKEKDISRETERQLKI